jgi:hypothetical protein
LHEKIAFEIRDVLLGKDSSTQFEQSGPETVVPGNSDDFRPEYCFYVPAISREIRWPESSAWVIMLN